MSNWIEGIFILGAGALCALLAFRTRANAGLYALAKRLVIALFVADTLLRAFGLETWRSLPVTVVLYGFVFFFIASTGLPPGKGFEGERDAWKEPKARLVMRRSFGFAGLAATVLGLCALFLFPVPAIAAPDGPYRVGTQSFQLADPERTDPYAVAAGDQAAARNVMVQAWYPVAQGARGEKAAWLPDEAVRDALADMPGIPRFLMSHLKLARLPAITGSDPAPGSWPVVILSHGWTGTRFLHADLAMELASRGILVLALDHPYGALSVTLANGEVIDNFPGALPGKDGDPGFWDRARTLVGSYSDDQLMLAKAIRDGRLPAAIANAADPGAIALAGHSTGGGAAVLSARTDPSIRAVLGLDAWVAPLQGEADLSLACTQLHVGSQAWDDGGNEPWLDRVLASGMDARAFRLTRTRHEDYAMTFQVTPAARFMGLSGGIAAGELRQALRLGADWLAACLRSDASGSAAALERAGELSAYLEH